MFKCLIFLLFKYSNAYIKLFISKSEYLLFFSIFSFNIVSNNILLFYSSFSFNYFNCYFISSIYLNSISSDNIVLNIYPKS